ncbi:hypothetical protein ACWEOE_34025 [Amycolatopsis sp. NPDC004368]
MSVARRKQEYVSHDIWRFVESIRKTASEVEPPLSNIGEDGLEYIRDVIANLSDHRENWNPLLRPQHLQALQGHIMNADQNLKNFQNNRNDAYINEAVSQLVEVARITLSWPPLKDSYFRGVMSTSEEFQLQAQKKLEELLVEAGDFKHEIEILKGQVEENRLDYGNHLNDAQSQVQRLSSTIDSEIQRIDAAVGDMSSRFSNEIADRQEKFSESQKINDEKFEELYLEESKKGNASLDELTALKKKAEELVGAVGWTATATDYGKYAQQERVAANWLRGLALVFFSGSFIWLLLGHVVQPDPSGGFWQQAVIRIVGAVALLGGGLYSARESAQHQRQSRLAKSKQLDLKALDPFIITLPESEQMAIKTEAARRLFVEKDADNPGETSTGHPIEEVAKALTSLVQNATKEKN